MAKPRLDVLLGPREWSVLEDQDLGACMVVVLDILRATTTMVTALAQGAEAIIPVSEIDEALDVAREHPEGLLAGERGGTRITADITGDRDFDLGNSPREFTAEKVRGKTIVMTTTNGTRAIRSGARAQQTLIASFLNMRATSHYIREQSPERLIVVCSGTGQDNALEDMLGAGALCEQIWSSYSHGDTSDNAELVRRFFPVMSTNLREAFRQSANGKRLAGMQDLAEDLRFCAQREIYNLVAGTTDEGNIVKLA